MYKSPTICTQSFLKIFLLMMRRTFTIAVLTLFVLVLPAQSQDKRPLQHEDVNEWIRIGSTRLSEDGKWVAWVEAPDEGDGVLHVSSADGKTSYSIPRGSSPTISYESRYVFFSIVPQADSVRQKKIDKVKSKDMPSDTLGILSLSTGAIEKIPNVDSFKAPSEGDGWMAYLLNEEASKPKEEPKDSTAVEKEEEKTSEEKSSEETPDSEKKKDKKEGKTLVVKYLNSGMGHEFRDVTSYEFAKNGSVLGFLKEDKKGISDGAFMVLNGKSDEVSLLQGEGNYVGLALSDDGKRISFLTNRDDFSSDQPTFSLFLGTTSQDVAAVVAKEGTDGIPSGWWVSEHQTPSFSDSGSRLFFGTAPRPAPEKKDDDVLDSEKVKVDIWNWKDPLLQPMQLLQASREKNRAYDAVLHIESGKLVQLATEEIPSVTVSQKRDGKMALGTSNMAYQQEISWESPGFQDAWIVDAETGERSQILTAVQDSPRLSPEGNYITYWDRDNREWIAIHTKTKHVSSLSDNAAYPVYDEIHDWPFEPDDYGSAGWIEGDSEFVFYDGFDVLAAKPTGELRDVTKGYGRKNGIRLRVQNLDFQEPSISSKEPWMLSGQNLDTMDAGYFSVNPRSGAVKSLIFGPKDYRIYTKAKHADVVLFTQSDFREFPDLRTSDLTLSKSVRLSDANPQQDQFTWGSSELVEWTSIDGELLKGILYKPDGFDATQKYPMMVYFYEKNSTGLNRYIAPGPSSSSINYAFYVSRGYLLFVPDIPYKIGYPGESAMNAVMPGITSLIDKGFVDRDRVGVQGHSWGGYQIAYMVTQTNLFAAAEAGAPVVNMTSAYGGIRWASGMSRAFQYERTQSRIGGTLWNAQQRYIHNSPLFQADKVQTPLLMMHNDDDGAVPWYQGIEYFSALRRLQKPTWMFNYNGAGHGLSDLVDRRDWAIRLQQFFDHYLMDAPAPVWLEQGVPAVQKGQTLGLELLDN